MTEAPTSRTRIIRETSHPHLPHGCVLVQHVARDGVSCDVIVTAIGPDGHIVTEQRETASLDDAVRLDEIESTLSSTVKSALEQHLNN